MAADAELGDLYLATPEEHWSATAMMAGVVAWEAALRELGVGAGDRVGVRLSSGATAVMQLWLWSNRAIAGHSFPAVAPDRAEDC
ncbi:hypothetical protein HC928_09995, partial [bacterium]|nr:hypothetical protein [bacterium]